MVGKPNFPDDVDDRKDLKGSAVGTPGLTALDEEREASLADEGGQSGAQVESQDLDELRELGREVPGVRLAETDACARRGVRLAAAVGVATALGAFAFRRWRH